MRQYRLRAFALLAALFAVSDVSAQAATDWCARLDSLRQGAAVWEYNAVNSAAAGLLPGGFGGITTTYFFLKQPADSDSARRVARVLAGCTADPYPVRLFSLVQTGAVRAGDYDWLELQHWYDVILKRVPWDSVRSASINGGMNRLTYSFATQAALDTFRLRATRLGVPLAVLRLSLAGRSWH
jgi:hypothetical protein